MDHELGDSAVLSSLCMCGVFFSFSEEESDEDRIKVILTSGEFPYF